MHINYMQVFIAGLERFRGIDDGAQQMLLGGADTADYHAQHSADEARSVACNKCVRTGNPVRECIYRDVSGPARRTIWFVEEEKCAASMEPSPQVQSKLPERLYQALNLVSLQKAILVTVMCLVICLPSASADGCDLTNAYIELRGSGTTTATYCMLESKAQKLGCHLGQPQKDALYPCTGDDTKYYQCPLGGRFLEDGVHSFGFEASIKGIEKANECETGQLNQSSLYVGGELQAALDAKDEPKGGMYSFYQGEEAANMVVLNLATTYGDPPKKEKYPRYGEGFHYPVGEIPFYGADTYTDPSYEKEGMSVTKESIYIYDQPKDDTRGKTHTAMKEKMSFITYARVTQKSQGLGDNVWCQFDITEEGSWGGPSGGWVYPSASLNLKKGHGCNVMAKPRKE